MDILCFFGIFLCPMFTFGAVLIHYGHPILGIIAILLWVLNGLVRTDCG